MKLPKAKRLLMASAVYLCTALAVPGAATAYDLHAFKQCLADAESHLERSECYWKRSRSRGATR